jgi:hypothetical protein
MVDDEDLADLVRELIPSLTAFEEPKRCGGLTSVVNTDMAYGLSRGDLMVRVGKDGRVAASA